MQIGPKRALKISIFHNMHRKPLANLQLIKTVYATSVILYLFHDEALTLPFSYNQTNEWHAYQAHWNCADPIYAIDVIWNYFQIYIQKLYISHKLQLSA